jgi:O-methyltransferase
MKLIKIIILKLFSHFGYQINRKYEPPETNILRKRFAEITDYEIELIKKCQKYTMTTDLRMWYLICAFYWVVNKNVKGDFVECGVWEGGNLILLQNLLEKNNINSKRIYGFDTFDGMVEPTLENDGLQAYNEFLYTKKNNLKWCYASLDKVKNNFNENTSCAKKEKIYNQVLDKKVVDRISNLNLIKGKVEDTLLDYANIPSDISILRLDTDFYKSTKIELEVLYKNLSYNGILIIDDYGTWKGSKKAVDEFFCNTNIKFFYVDEGCRFLIKQ